VKRRRLASKLVKDRQKKELINEIKENLSLSISMDSDYEGERLYTSASVNLYYDSENISSDYDSVC
jgi:hypothetical protein